jgi:hypothetical protein
MRSIGNDVKSTNVDSSSSITQTHLDDLDKSRDTHQAAAITAESTARTTAIITAVATETAARTTAITAVVTDSEAYTNAMVHISEGYTDNAITTAHTKITENGYFEKIITSNTNISNMGLGDHYAGFSHKDKANANDYALLQHKDGSTAINASAGEPINLLIAGSPVTRFESNEAIFNVPIQCPSIATNSAAISTMGFENQDAGFAQKDHENTTSFALLQDKDGETSINTANGKPINFRVNGATKAYITATDATFNLPITTTTAKISQAGWNETDVNGTMAVFSHKDRATTNSYAFCQHSGGTTYINSGDSVPGDGLGQINVRINDGGVATFTSTAITFLVATSGSSDRRFKKNITVPSPSKNWTDFKLIGVKQYNKVYPNINSDKLRLGVIAQELEAIDNPICKNAVKEITLEKPTDPVELDIYNQGTIFTDASGEEHSGGFKAVEYEQLYRMNLIITQQLMARVEALELALSKKS